MWNNIKSSLYKLSKDWTFRITLIIGITLSTLLVLIFYAADLLIKDTVDGQLVHVLCNGQSLFLSSLSPVQNFGLTVPINLVVYVIGEFNCGTIRNKIIAGHKKSSIYFSLLITGVIFTVVLMFIYFTISVGLSTLLGGFETPGGESIIFGFKDSYLYQIPLMALAVYILITTFAVFVATNIRTIGGSMPIVIIAIVLLYFLGMVPTISRMFESLDGQFKPSFDMWLNPLYTFGVFGTNLLTFEISDIWTIASIVTPLYWSVIFTGLGLLTFKLRDVK